MLLHMSSQCNPVYVALAYLLHSAGAFLYLIDAIHALSVVHVHGRFAVVVLLLL